MMKKTDAPTGWPCMDRLLRGVPMGQLACFAAHPSDTHEGPKSNFANDLIYRAIRDGQTVLYVNTEADIRPFTLGNK